MIESSEAYKAAVVGDARRTYIRVVVDISDPDISYDSISALDSAPWTKADELHDKVFEFDKRYASLESNRWLLDGTCDIFPDDFVVGSEIAFASDTISGKNGEFAIPQWMKLEFSGVSIIQAFSVYFSNDSVDGVPENFTVEVLQGDVAYFTKEYVGNAATNIHIEGFTIHDPDAIRITVTKWSLPHRRMRITEIIVGIYEVWDNDTLSVFHVKQQGDISNTSVPYGTCEISMDNIDRRFEPRAKSSLFQSIEERQGLEVSIGVDTYNGVEYKPLGMFYQFLSGWKTSGGGLSVQWSLVDIIGLLSDREFLIPETLPTTLDGWISSIVSQLGENFANRYIVDENFANFPVTANDREELTGMTCGDVLKNACMVAGVWARSDAETGFLAAEPLWSQGNRLTIDNLISYPTMKANSDVAAIVFTLHDGLEDATQFVVSGTSAASSETISVDNPFIHSEEQALEAARLILAAYGGNRVETTGRGDPSSEIGDVETVELDEHSAMSARRIFQTFVYQNGVLQQCQSTLLQANGELNFSERVFLTDSGIWTAPPGVSRLRIILGGGGQGGTSGNDGTWDAAGEPGTPGAGGKIWYDIIDINPEQSFEYSVGAGGIGGALGSDTTFGNYNSVNGKTFDPSYTDIINGDVYGRRGAENPRENTSDGGAGGAGGAKGNRRETAETITHYYFDEFEIPASTYNLLKPYSGIADRSLRTDTTETTRTVIDNVPGAGEAGKNGADGFILIYYNKLGG